MLEPAFGKLYFQLNVGRGRPSNPQVAEVSPAKKSKQSHRENFS